MVSSALLKSGAKIRLLLAPAVQNIIKNSALFSKASYKDFKIEIPTRIVNLYLLNFIFSNVNKFFLNYNKKFCLSFQTGINKKFSKMLHIPGALCLLSDPFWWCGSRFGRIQIWIRNRFSSKFSKLLRIRNT